MENNNLFKRVYFWMTIALVISGFCAMSVGFNPALYGVLLQTGPMIALVIAELVLVFVISFMFEKLSTTTAVVMFLLFSIINGITLSTVFLVYEIGSIFSTFFITAGTFAITSVYGYITKTDLTKLGNLLLMAVIGLILAGIVNWFIGSTVFDLIISVAGVVIFTGLVAYDTQKIKEIAQYTDSHKVAIIGALSLYLDFVNLFLYLLRLLGNKK